MSHVDEEKAMVDDILALVRDARRYRKLRDMHWSNSKLAVVSTSLLQVGTQTYSREQLDERLDEILRQEPDQPVNTIRHNADGTLTVKVAGKVY